jgi:hypothetical protein
MHDLVYIPSWSAVTLLKGGPRVCQNYYQQIPLSVRRDFAILGMPAPSWRLLCSPMRASRGFKRPLQQSPRNPLREVFGVAAIEKVTVPSDFDTYVSLCSRWHFRWYLGCERPPSVCATRVDSRAMFMLSLLPRGTIRPPSGGRSSSAGLTSSGHVQSCKYGRHDSY